MDVFLLRHAEAEEQRPGRPDGERELTDRGHERARRAAEWLAAQGMQVEAIISSPLIRAVQTAQPVAEALGMAIVTDKRLAGMRLTAESVREMAREYQVGESVLLVGHEPDLGDLIQELTRGQVEVKKAALALVSCGRVSAGDGMLRWLVPSKLQAG